MIIRAYSRERFQPAKDAVTTLLKRLKNVALAILWLRKCVQGRTEQSIFLMVPERMLLS